MPSDCFRGGLRSEHSPDRRVMVGWIFPELGIDVDRFVPAYTPRMEDLNEAVSAQSRKLRPEPGYLGQVPAAICQQKCPLL